jgi:outer membrane protein
MNTRKRPLTLLACALAAALSTAAAQAHEAGDWLIRGGLHNINPHSDNGGIVEVDGATMISFNVLYMFSRNWGVELLGSLPFEHDISLKNGPEVASVKHLPPTLSVVYHILPDSPIAPYFGVGLNATLFFDESTKGALAGSKLSLDHSFGLAAVAGVDIPLGSNWFLNADVRYLDIETDAKLDGAKLGTVKIDPWALGLSLAYKF